MMTSRRSSERLTQQALRQHDKLHPRLHATPTPRSHAPPLPDHAHTKDKAQAPKESSQSGVGAMNSGSKHPMKKHAMTVYRLVTATRSWQRYTRKNTGALVPVMYENTYQLQPDTGSKFSSARVEVILREVLESRLQKVQYSAEQCRRHTTELVNVIRTRIKNCHFPRYKLVCNVLIMENRGQGSRVVSRGLTNTDTDSFATYTFQNPSLVAVAYVHAVWEKNLEIVV